METFTESKTYGIISNGANRKIIENLETRGAKVFRFAPFETKSIENTEIISFIQNNLANFEWLILPDVLAVDFFLGLLEKSEIDLFELDEKKILAFGEAVADRLRFSQIHADIIPDSAETDDIFSAVLAYLPSSELARIKFLLPKFSGFKSGLEDKLTEIGAEVVGLEIYRINYKTDKETAKLKALLTGGAVDVFIFTSPEDVFFLTQFLFPQTVSDVLAELQIFGINEITMQTLRENGLSAKYFQGK